MLLRAPEEELLAWRIGLDDKLEIMEAHLCQVERWTPAAERFGVWSLPISLSVK